MARVKIIAPIDDELVLLRRMRSAPVSENTKCKELLLSEWRHYKGPHLFSVGSTVEVWWLCEAKGVPHSFTRPICRRTKSVNKEKPSKFRGCPYCAGRKSFAAESLSALFPELAEEWHIELGGLAAEVSPRSQRMGQWSCSNGHTHACTVATRTQEGQDCPECYVGERVDIARFPALAEQFERSDRNLGYDPGALPVGHKVWWQCQRNSKHSYYRSFIQLRESSFSCPRCRRASADTLAHFPQLAAQIDPKRNGKLRPSKLLAGSHVKLWWNCPRHPNDAWQATVFNRCLRGDGCPFCSNKRVCKDNCLATRYPCIAREYHPTRNGDLTPEMIVATSTAVFWWICACCGHEYQRQLRSRTRGSRCPQCKVKSVVHEDSGKQKTTTPANIEKRNVCHSELI